MSNVLPCIVALGDVKWLGNSTQHQAMIVQQLVSFGDVDDTSSECEQSMILFIHLETYVVINILGYTFTNCDARLIVKCANFYILFEM